MKRAVGLALLALAALDGTVALRRLWVSHHMTRRDRVATDEPAGDPESSRRRALSTR